MSPDDVSKSLQRLPSVDKLIEACSGVLSGDVLDGVRALELDSGDTLGCLWAELLGEGVIPEEFFREKGIIQ